MVINTFLTLLIIALALFLGQIAVQLLKIERKLENTVEILEEELIDVFGSAPGERAAPAGDSDESA